jgi:thymidylate synthase
MARYVLTGKILVLNYCNFFHGKMFRSCDILTGFHCNMIIIIIIIIIMTVTIVVVVVVRMTVLMMIN